MSYDRAAVASRIDAALLDPEVTAADVRHFAAAALVQQVRGVCVRPALVPVAAAEVAGSGLEIVTVVGFPDGTDPTGEKVAAVEAAADAGAYEVDVVMDHRTVAAGDRQRAASDLGAVVEAAHHADLGCKIIIEVGALDARSVITACELAVAAGADFVKTSTGFGPRGATPDDVRRMRAAVGTAAGVKAAGGIRSFRQAVTLLEAGADVLGISAFVAVLDQAPRGSPSRKPGSGGPANSGGFGPPEPPGGVWGAPPPRDGSAWGSEWAGRPAGRKPPRKTDP